MKAVMDVAESGYDYKELAYDLYRAGDELLDDLVAMRKRRGMTQAQLADEMNVTQGYVSQIENGKTKLVSLLTDYALEVGARIEYVVEPAENKPEGRRHYVRQQCHVELPASVEWTDGAFTAGPIAVDARVELRRDGAQAEPYRVVLLPASSTDAAASADTKREEAMA